MNVSAAGYHNFKLRLHLVLAALQFVDALRYQLKNRTRKNKKTEKHRKTSGCTRKVQLDRLITNWL
jgi:hypothetical protein